MAPHHKSPLLVEAPQQVQLDKQKKKKKRSSKDYEHEGRKQNKKVKAQV